MKQCKIRILVLLLALLPAAAGAGELPQVKPSEVGMSAKKLADVDRVVNALVTRKRLAGAIVMVARHGKVVLQKSYGQMDIEAKKPMRDDAIVRIYLMTTNQLSKDVRGTGRHSPGMGFGLGLSVRVDPHKNAKVARKTKVGECGWGGAASTHFWISPADGLAVVTLEQIQPYSTQTKAAVKGIIYDAIEK